MRNKFFLPFASIFLVMISVAAPLPIVTPPYDPQYCSLMTANNGSVAYNLIKISRKDNRIKADYMSSAGSSGTIKARYEAFKRLHPNIVAYSSGGYMINSSGGYAPEGLNIDHGNVVNRELVQNRFDALVVVYPNGGIAVNNLTNNSVVTDAGTFNMKTNPSHVDGFIQWAQRNRATVFQTHLLAEKNELKIKPGKYTSAPRRFLVASKDQSTGVVFHYIIQRDATSQINLYDGAIDALGFFKKRGISVEWMINLDTGMQDTFGFFTSDGNPHPQIKGNTDMNDARNLIIYYYE